MKNKFYFLYYLFRPLTNGLVSTSMSRSGLIVILLLYFSATVIAQESTPPEEFPVGTAIGESLINTPGMFERFAETDLNTIYQRADISIQDLLEDYNLLAFNSEIETEYIYHYSSSYYSKWEAEQNQTDPARVGVKHTSGDTATWKEKLCWSTKNYSYIPDELLMFGPHYYQDKTYKRLYPPPGWGQVPIKYNVRFNMALENTGSVPPDENVCIIKVIYRYKEVETGIFHIEQFLGQTLKVQDFDTNGSFDLFDFEGATYDYDEQFYLPGNLDKLIEPPAGTITKTDLESFTGIQFVVDWLRNDDDCTLYIDYVEVYDNFGWNDYIVDPARVDSLVRTYAQNFPSSEWPNIKYWGGMDEPSTIDAYTPIHIVDEIIRSVQAPPLINSFNPLWRWDHLINGEVQMSQFVSMAKPYKLLLAVNPCDQWNPVLTFNQLDWLRYNLQLASELDSSFWFAAQTHGLLTSKINGSWCVWRKPEPPELTSMVMLALAHGAKGMQFMWFDSYGQEQNNGSCVGYYWEAIVDEHASPLNLYPVVKDEIVPRLKGTLGNTLMNLDYTSNYINKECNDNCPQQDDPEFDYLTLNNYPTNYFWHIGFFNQNNFPNNEYFLLTNLRTLSSKTAFLTIANNTGYENVSFTDIEGGVDTTIGFDSSITYYEEMPAGEGKLYRVSPVILYGGRLIYDEIAGEDITLMDDMTVENGATLSISNTYFANGNIIIKDGSIVNLENGKIQFAFGKKLIIEGPATISGTEGNKLILDFVSPENENGIVIDSEGALNISYCEVKNAETGILAEVESISFDIQYVDFIDCGSNSINILGQAPELFGSTQRIKYCTIENSSYGISAANLSEILIQQNTITNTDLGIFLSGITNAQVISNQIHTNTEELEGIFVSSCDGVIRGNGISDHTVGIHLANSSPDVGGNGITGCLYHAMYIGTGSNPNMRGRLVQDIYSHSWYAISGYNTFENNGGYEGGSYDNDGSEIFFNESNAVMREGCNSIVDDRQPQGELINTLLLMNGLSSTFFIEIKAEYNYWGETQVTGDRFGDLIVNYNPYYSAACPTPQQDEGAGLITTTSAGEVIDTLYPAREDNSSLSDVEILYASANKFFFTGEVEASENYYDQIINSDTTISAKKEAYARKYEIGKMLNRDAEYFEELRNTYLSLSASASDSLLKKIFDQLSKLCLVAREEIIPAISEFDEIVQQNPNTEKAIYAEIDALTAALLVEGNDSTMQKGTLGKYLVKSSGDYNAKLDGLLRKHFGNKAQETEEEILPTQYTLHQNYPNPFNPNTTIKYDLPNTSKVTIIIYDILGRKIKELVNEKQQAGRYEVQFNASNLSSGVYIYQLVAEKYMNSKKMILLK